MSRFDRSQALALVLVCAATALVATAVLIGSTPDDEEFRFAVLSTHLHVRSLSSGAHPFWTPALGLGVPQPFVPNFNLHPLSPALAALSPTAWVRTLLFLHTVAGALGVWMIGRRLAMAPIARAACAATLLLSAPTQNYLLTDFWPSHYIVWTSAPWLLLLAWRVLEDDSGAARSSIVLGLVGGLVLASTNPGHAVVYATLVAGLLLTHWRALRARWAWLALAGAIAAAIALPNLVQLATEAWMFGTGFGVSNLPEALPVTALVDAFFRPLRDVESARVLWFGGPFAALAVLAAFWFRNSRTDLVACAILSTVVLFIGSVPIGPASGRYQFRDPLTLAAIILAGLAVDRLLRADRTRWIGNGLIALQLVVTAAAAWPFLQRTWEPEGRQAMAFNGATGQTPLVDRLIADMPAVGRVLFSPDVDHDVSERTLLRDGLGVNALAYRGAAVVNGSFKGVSADSLWPDDRLFYGRIRTPGPLVTSTAGLDVLSIRYVIARSSEAVAPDLQPRGSLKTLRGADLVLYENPDAWPGAFLVGALFGDRDLPILPACENERLLCRDFADVARNANAAVTVHRDATEIRARWDAVPNAAVLVVTEMYRPDWVATAGDRPLTTRVMYGGLLGVPLPGGVSSVELRYRPRGRMIASALAYAAIVMAVGMLFTVARRQSVQP